MASMTRRQHYSPEQIVDALHCADELLGSGESVSKVCREIGVTELTFYRWCHRYGGIGRAGLARLTRLEAEILALRHIVRAQADQISTLAAVTPTNDGSTTLRPPAPGLPGAARKGTH